MPACPPASRRSCSPCARAGSTSSACCSKAGADVNEVIPSEAGHAGEATAAACRPRARGPLLLAVTNGHFELAAALLEAGADPNANADRLHRAPCDHRGPQAGRGDDDPPPEGSGTLSSLEFVRSSSRTAPR